MIRRAPASAPSGRLVVLAALGGMAAFGPLSMDLYLPGIPQLAADLGASESLGQLTMSACMVGLALGQLFWGPLSDRFGRRSALMAGVGLFTLASVLCVFAPSVGVLMVFRLLQGIGGSAGIVLSRAIVRDLYPPEQTARILSRLMLVSGLAPILAPVIGGQILAVTDWHGLFIALAVIGAMLLLWAYLVIPESLAPANRTLGTLGHQMRQVGAVIADRRFMTLALMLGFVYSSLYAYISMGTFVFQEQFEVSPQGYSLIFGINALGITAGSQLNAALVARRGSVNILTVALIIGVIATAGIVVAALLGLGLVMLLIPLFFAIAIIGATSPNIQALALSPYVKNAGAASGVLGVSQFLVGAIVPPLLSIRGTDSVLMAWTMFGSLIIAAGLLVLSRRQTASTLQRPN